MWHSIDSWGCVSWHVDRTLSVQTTHPKKNKPLNCPRGKMHPWSSGLIATSRSREIKPTLLLDAAAREGRLLGFGCRTAIIAMHLCHGQVKLLNSHHHHLKNHSCRQSELRALELTFLGLPIWPREFTFRVTGPVPYGCRTSNICSSTSALWASVSSDRLWGWTSRSFLCPFLWVSQRICLCHLLSPLQWKQQVEAGLSIVFCTFKIKQAVQCNCFILIDIVKVIKFVVAF